MKKTIQKITIIIPTRNRCLYLKRILNYYNNFNSAFKIIVSDSSSKENKMANREIIRSFPELKIFHVDKYEENIDPWHKFSDVINYVKTKYSVVCADDDFITPNGIIKSADFLEKNPDFTIAHGHPLSFYFNSEKRKLLWSDGCSPNSITFPDAQMRLMEHLSNYTSSTFYAVHRTKFLKMITKETIRFANDNRFSELLPSMLALIYGKMKYLDVFYTAREVDIKSTSVTTETIPDFIKKGSYNEKYDNFKNCLADHLSKNSNLGIEESKKTIDGAMSVYLNRNYPDKFLRYKINNIVEPYSSNKIFEKIKYSYIKWGILRQIRKSHITADNLPPQYSEDFYKIRDCVMLYVK